MTLANPLHHLNIDPIHLAKDVVRNLEPSLHAQHEARANENIGETKGIVGFALDSRFVGFVVEGRRLPDKGGSSSSLSIDWGALKGADDDVFISARQALLGVARHSAESRRKRPGFPGIESIRRGPQRHKQCEQL